MNAIRRIANWLRGDSANAKPQIESPIGYPDVPADEPAVASRNIFCFWDGSCDRGIDPLVAYRKLIKHPEFNAEKHLPLIDEQGDPDSIEITVKAVREVFGVVAWQSTGIDAVTGKLKSVGLTEAETLDLLRSYFAYCDRVKKNGSVSPTSSELTGLESAREDNAAGSEYSASGSTFPEPKAGELLAS